MTTLQQHLNALTQQRRLLLKESITIAGLMHSNGKSTKSYFRKLSKESSGHTKKIYIALSKAKAHNLDGAFNLFCDVLQ